METETCDKWLRGMDVSSTKGAVRTGMVLIRELLEDMVAFDVGGGEWEILDTEIDLLSNSPVDLAIGSRLEIETLPRLCTIGESIPGQTLDVRIWVSLADCAYAIGKVTVVRVE